MFRPTRKTPRPPGKPAHPGDTGGANTPQAQNRYHSAIFVAQRSRHPPARKIEASIEGMTVHKLAATAVVAIAASLTLAPASHADPDIDFANQLHSFGIYGQRDYNAWLGKIMCKRLGRGLDADLYESVNFVTTNLARGTTQGQAVQFVGAAINTYCPDQIGVLQRAAV